MASSLSTYLPPLSFPRVTTPPRAIVFHGYSQHTRVANSKSHSISNFYAHLITVIRTGMAFVGLGVAIDQLNVGSSGSQGDSPLSTNQTPTQKLPIQEQGSTLLQSLSHYARNVDVPAVMSVCVGGVVVSYATTRYHTVQTHLLKGQFPVNSRGIKGMVLLTSSFTLIALSMLFFPSVSNAIIKGDIQRVFPKQPGHLQVSTPPLSSSPPPSITSNEDDNEYSGEEERRE